MRQRSDLHRNWCAVARWLYSWRCSSRSLRLTCVTLIRLLVLNNSNERRSDMPMRSVTLHRLSSQLETGFAFVINIAIWSWIKHGANWSGLRIWLARQRLFSQRARDGTCGNYGSTVSRTWRMTTAGLDSSQINNRYQKRTKLRFN